MQRTLRTPSHLLSAALFVGLIFLAVGALGCAADDGLSTGDGRVPDGASDGSAPGFVVAAIQYGTDDHKHVAACNDDACALRHYIDNAADQGAKLVVTSEYALAKASPEPTPEVGENPGSDASATSLIAAFSRLAATRGIYLVIDLITYKGVDPSIHYFNTQVAFDPTGKVVALHRKFNLYENEKAQLTPGDDVSTFDTPAGKVGLLICADIYGDATLIKKLTKELGARIIALSSDWVKAGVDSAFFLFAKGYAVYLVAANTTKAPGFGGGVYDDQGRVLVEKLEAKPSILVATIPML